MISLVYNALLFLIVAVFLGVAAKRPSVTVAVAGLGSLSLAGLILAAMLGENIFGSIRLVCYGIFLHGLILLSGFGFALRKSFRKSTVFCAVSAGLLALVALDAFLIEPHWLEVSHVTFRSPKIKRPIRVAVIADFQTDHIGDYERSVWVRVQAEKADLILLAGDHLQEEGPGMAPLRDAFRSLLRDLPLSAPLGIFAVRGNIDTSDWARAFDGLPVKTLEKTQSIDLGDLRLTALSMADSFDVNLSVPPSDRFQLVLGHSPDFALGQVQGDLLVAGHTHGGQIRIPGVGAIMTESHIPRSWAAGVTTLTGSRTLVVSRGIGMERGTAPRLRFLCRPELVVIDIVP